MAEMLFKDFVTANTAEIKTFMQWNTYDFNDHVLPIVDILKEHALLVLSKSYGRFTVDDDIKDEFCADVFTNFPVLMQQLSITTLIDGDGVKPTDTNTMTTTRTESTVGEISQESELNAGTTQTNTEVLNTSQETTGTVGVENSSTNTLTGSTDITNSSTVAKTGARNVNLSHNLPEQAINGITGDFPVDDQGTPLLDDAYVQTATENLSTSNPITTSETSNQDVSNLNEASGNSTTTNDVTVAETGTNTRTLVNSGADSSDSLTNSSQDVTIEETVSSTETNKQYAYEFKAFLDTAGSINAFKVWEDCFYWVPGII